MKKFRLLLALMLASVGAMQEASARVEPTFPKAQALESGKAYYLYNVGSGEFAYQNSGYARASETSKTSVIITAQDNGYYTLQFSDNNYYWYMGSTSSNEMGSTSSLSSSNYFRIAVTEGGYTIQRNYSYDENHFVGVSSNSIYANLVSGNLIWQLFDEDGAEAVLHYKAKKALYDALETAEVNYAFAIGSYEAIYENEASTTAELNEAAATLRKSLSMSAGYQAPWWNERPIVFYTSDGSYGQGRYDTWALPNNNNTSGSYFIRRVEQGKSSSISATVMVEEPSTLVYGLYGDDLIRVFVDGTEVRALYSEQHRNYPSDKTHTRFFEELEPGLHTITWTCIAYSNADYNLYDVSVMSKPQITLSLLEPGSLGTEVLYNTDHIKNVRRLKVKGAMNNDDWARIKMMSTLLELDLSEAQFTEIPANQFKVSSSDTTMNFLHKVVLPEGLTTIGDYAFNYSFVESINLPSTMRRVGKEAFRYSHAKELIMPDDMTDFYGGDKYGYCFEYMYWLKKLILPKNLTKIPNNAFYYCAYITEAVMPEKLQEIGERGFYTCHRMQTTLPEGLKVIGNYAFYNCAVISSPLPSTLTTIGESAFRYARGYQSLVIPQNVTSIGADAFRDCTNMTKVELSVEQFSLADGVFQGCSQLDTLKLKSSTVTSISSTYPLSDITKMVLQVPHYLVNDYKLHSYWYNAKSIEPFDYSEISFIPIHGNLTLNHERFGGQPSIHILQSNSYLKINGDAEQKFDEIWISTNLNGQTGQLLNNCDHITATGDNLLDYYTQAQKWYFISLPFDLDVSRIWAISDGAQYAIRYYEGEGRAANGKSGNWKNVDRTGIIPAGTGFIYQTNIATWTRFFAADTENKYGTLRTEEFNKPLEVNASETASNRGWNLVGNPYQCFYNNHCLNFTAPITIWSPDNKTYTAYSLTDDDYAIRPNEAFFVQCPNEEYATIGFPLQGRQLTSVIESQNAVKAQVPQAQTRFMVNLTVGDGETEDMTRVVLNEQASTTYEVSCDASKFMSMDGSVPQLYTIGNEDTWYAINERPLDDGIVQLGFFAGKDGVYTLRTTRCDAKQVLITDNLTGETVDITDSNYTFSATAGTHNSRFTLNFTLGTATSIEAIAKTDSVNEAEVYSVDGKLVGTNARNLGTGVYIVRQGNKTGKVVVR